MKKHFPWIVSLGAALLLGGCDEAQAPSAEATPPARWQMSAEYVANTMFKSDAAIAEALQYHEIARLDGNELPGGVYARYRRMAGNMRLKPLPALYLDAMDERTLPQAMARFTREGRALVIVNPAALDAWSPRELVAVLGHELVHLKERHVTAENLALAFNHAELSVEHELTADREGSGPLGSCDPEALRDALQIVFDMDRSRQGRQGDFDSLTGADHPTSEQRLAALDAMAENPPRGCR